MRTFICMAACAAVSAALIAVPASAARTAAVTLEDIRFKPGTVLVKKGDRVRWQWNDGSTPHNVASRGTRRFKSSSTKTRGTHLVRFTRAGTYRYVCTIHPGMKGKIVVR
jgi:plastocyanin